MIIGLTGGIATGKNTVADIMSKLGAKVIDADKISRKLTAKGSPVLKEISKVFGKNILAENGTLKRKTLARIIFSDKKSKLKLENILHEQIIFEIISAVKKEHAKTVVLNVPLLFEKKLDRFCDKTVVVWTPLKLQIKRLMLRDKVSLKDAQMRVSSQTPIEKKMKKADFVIDNSGSKTQLKARAQKLYKLLTA